MPIVQYWELDGYPKESRELGSFKATRKLLVDWDSRYLLREALIYHPPAIYPYFIPQYNLRLALRVRSVLIEPYGRSDLHSILYPDMIRYDWALLTVDYATPQLGDPQPYPQDKNAVLHERADAVVSETLEPYAEARREDHRLFKWSDGTELQANEAPVQLVYRNNYTLTRHNLTEIPAEVNTMPGKINSGTVTPILATGITFAAHTLLFGGTQLAWKTGDQGERLVDVTYRMLWKEEGWRKFWRADAQEYQTIMVKATDVDYDVPAEADFSVLFPQVTA